MVEKDEVTLALEDVGVAMPAGTSISDFSVTVAAYQYEAPHAGKWQGHVTTTSLYFDLSLAIENHDDMRISIDGIMSPFRFNTSNFNSNDTMRIMLRKLFNRAINSTRRGGRIGTSIRLALWAKCPMAKLHNLGHSEEHGCPIRPSRRVMGASYLADLGHNLEYVKRHSLPRALQEDPLARCLRETFEFNQDLPYEVIYARKKEEWDKLHLREVTTQP